MCIESLKIDAILMKMKYHRATFDTRKKARRYLKWQKLLQ